MDREAGPFAGYGLDLDLPAMLLDDSVADAQSQSRSVSDRLGREERIEDSLPDVRLDPAAVVLDVDSNAQPLGLGTGQDGHDAAVIGAGVDGIGKQIDDHLVN